MIVINSFESNIMWSDLHSNNKCAQVMAFSSNSCDSLMGLYGATHFQLCWAKKEINSYNNLWFQRDAVDNFLKSQKSTEASV